MTTLQLPLNTKDRVDVEGSGYTTNQFLHAGGGVGIQTPLNNRHFEAHIRSYPRKLVRYDVYEQNKLWMVLYVDYTRPCDKGWLDCVVGTVIVDGFAGPGPRYSIPYYC